jgi:hypothetical protein
VEFDDLVSEHLAATDEYESSFQMLGQAARDKETISSEVQHDRYAMSTIPMK